MSSRPNRGFALLLTVALLALLVIVVTSLLSILKSGSRGAAAGNYRLQARQNALLGLNVALGELQRTAGPDQSATARADIMPSPLPLKARWTGVWEQNRSTPIWLVSGNETSVSADFVATNEAPLVRLVATPSSGSDVNDHVAVMTVPLFSPNPGDLTQLTRSGRYGYWVGDEGIKATVNFSESLDSYDAGRQRQMLMARPRIERIFSSIDPSLPSTRAAVQKVHAFGQIREAATGTIQLALAFHDVTPLSMGVLSNPLDGGLKIDFATSSQHSALGGNLVAEWLSIRPVQQSGATATHATRGTSNGLMIAPMITEVALRFVFFRNGSTVATTNGNLAIHCQMQVEFWNPYTSFLAVDAGGMRISVSGLPTSVEVRSGAGFVRTIDLQGIFDQMSFVIPGGTIFAPGAVRTFYGGPAWNTTTSPENTPGAIVDTFIPIPSTTNSALRTLSVSSEETSSLSVSLQVGGATQVYASGIEFERLAIPEQSWGNSGGSNNLWMFGYGFGVRDSISFWADGSGPNAIDPRARNFDSAIVETVATVWRTNPRENRSGLIIRSAADASGRTFYGSASNPPIYALFELPRQDVVSLGALQHVPLGRQNSIGNAWGSSQNQLFDRAFISAIDRDAVWTNPPQQLGPNAFLDVYSGTIAASPERLREPVTAAENLWVRGAFNINSTSATAWRSALGGNVIPSGYLLSTELRHAYFRHSHSAQELSTSASEPGSVSAWRQGVRSIQPQQVDALAAAMATQLRGRGAPFRSVSEFLNSGILARALDPLVSFGGTLTASQETARSGINGSATASLQPGMPGYLSQADVVTMMAPFILSRSDTFRIRAYGAALNFAMPEGLPEAEAYCEAIVHRTPELLDPARPELGRRFVVASFRWLGPDDI